MTKRMSIFLLILIAMSLSVAGPAAQGAATPDATPAADAMTGMPSVEYIDEAGNVTAVLTVTVIEQEWTDHAEFFAPQPGNEFVRVTVEVGSRIGAAPSRSSLLLAAAHGRLHVSGRAGPDG